MARVSLETLLALSWTFTCLALMLTAGRFWIRSTVIRKLCWDDATHFLSLLCLLAQVSIVTGAVSLIYRLPDMNSENATKDEISLFFRLNIAGVILAWCCLYAVKATFLLLYRQIFQISKTFTRAWWITTTFVFLTFLVLFAGALTQCGSPSSLDDIDKCKMPSTVARARSYVIYGCVLNIASDLAIMALPLAMLRGLQLRMTAKVGLAALFCCAFITIAFDLLRAVETITNAGIAGSTALWTNLESAVAVIVSCLPSLVALRTSRKVRDKGKQVVEYRPRSLMVSDSAKGCMSGESSIHSGIGSSTTALQEPASGGMEDNSISVP